jgi:hypothetical protein
MSKVLSIKNRFSLSYDRKTHSLGYCPVTGIILEIKIPALPPSILLTYKNPLADMSNAIDVMNLPYWQISKTKIEVIAGCLLTILQHHDLIQDKLSSVERNEILCTFPAFDLYSLAKTIITFSHNKLARCPRLSLRECCSFHIPELLKIYTLQCVNCDAVEKEETIIISVHNKLGEVKVQTKEVTKTINNDTKKRVRYLISTIIEKEVLNPKIITVLKIISQGNNISTASNEVKTKLIEKLDTLTSSEATELSNILFDSMQDTGSTEKESGLADISYGKRKTIKEILAEKQQQKTTIVESKEEDDSDEF